MRILLLSMLLLLTHTAAWSKNPPPGTGSADVKANILIMLDSSGSMNEPTTVFKAPDLVFDSAGNFWAHKGQNWYGACDLLKFNPASPQKSLTSIGINALYCEPYWGTTDWHRRRLAIDSSDNVHITDYRNNKIVKYNSSDGSVLRTFTGLTDPRGLAVDDSGNVYASSTTRLRKWASSGATVWDNTIPTAENKGIAYYNGFIYVIEGGMCGITCKLRTYNATTGLLDQTHTIREHGHEDIVVNANGIYISSQSKIDKYDLSGVYQSSFAPAGGNNAIKGIAADSTGAIYAVNSSTSTQLSRNKIHKWAADGTQTDNIVTEFTTRMTDARDIVQALMDDSDLTTGANFGLMDWDSRANMLVNITATSNATVRSTVATMSPGGGTNPQRALEAAKAYFIGPNSPIDTTASCQKSLNILISDGQWWVDPVPIASDLSNNLGINTVVVGYSSGISNTTSYEKLAVAGGTGTPVFSSNVNHLISTLSSLIRQTIAAQQTFSAPFIQPSVSSADHIYQSTFTYKENHQWEGHLIKRRLVAVTGAIGTKVWDAGTLLDTRAEITRKIWTIGTDQGINTHDNNFTRANLAGLKTLLWERSGTSHTDAQTNDLINFVRGIDAYDEDGDGSKSDERWKLGDIYHSELAIVGPPGAKSSSTALKSEAFYRSSNNYETWQHSFDCGGKCDQRPEVIYVGGNDGMLHAFESATGNELWAFIPPMVLPKLHHMISPDANKSISIYGVDGSPITRDVFYGGQWRTILIAGLRAGGKGYFALDITDPTNPLFLYGFEHDQTSTTVYYWDSTGHRSQYSYADLALASNSAFDFTKLGESWSTPMITLLALPSGDRQWVAVFGAGYNSGTNTNYGSAVFIIDLENGGHILKRIDLTDNPGGVANSVPSTVEFVTADTTSAATYKGAMVYLVDLESKLWKINLTDQGTLYDKTLLFNSQGDRTNGRISWYTPTITLNANKKLWLYYGTGDLTNLQQMTAGLGNHIYGIQDASFPLFTSTIAGTLPNLTNITPAASICPSGADLGWYRTLDVNEKVTGKIAIYNETLFVSRYTPNITNLCTPGTAVLSEHGSACGNQLGSSSLGPGVATSPIVHKGKIYVGISGEGGGSTPLGAGYQRTDNIIVGEPTNAGSLTDGKATLESWREIW